MNRTVTGIAFVLTTLATAPALAQDYGGRPIRYGNTSGWFYDNRDDNRDFRTNGVFPGNFARDPFSASIGAAGIIGSNPWHSARPYPSQVVFGWPPDQSRCLRAHIRQARSRDGQDHSETPPNSGWGRAQ